MTDSDLVRFVNAQTSVYGQVLRNSQRDVNGPIGCGSSSRNTKGRAAECGRARHRLRPIESNLDKIARCLGVDDGLKAAIAFPTTPDMMDVPTIPILGPFGSDQIVTKLTAGSSESGTAIKSY